uniref:UBL3-like ubiquitin domain-containing protein n=1 Tax=Quercus lobata TaxID=97700 RepID=A0A7N2KYD1_QUELO
MPEEELVELKFRIYDGSDIGPFRYSPASTVAMVKERIVSEWPKGFDDTASFRIVIYVVVSIAKSSSIVKILRFKHRMCRVLSRKADQQDKKIIPKGANDIKLINAGKVLENNKTVGQCRVPFGELPRGVITMHAVVQPSLAKAKTEKKVDDVPRKSFCSCSIL